MITPAWVRMMSAYNMAMNRSVYAAAGRLDDAERKRDRGAFFGSIHATLNHLVWGDLTWMSRLAGWPSIGGGIRDGLTLYDEFPLLAETRFQTDARLSAWAEQLDPATLEGDLAWFSAVAQREVRRPRAMLVAHMFNHQTHHRGQLHAMLTAAGEQTGPTDLFVLVDGVA